MRVLYRKVGGRGNEVLIGIGDEMGNGGVLKKKLEGSVYLGRGEY